MTTARLFLEANQFQGNYVRFTDSQLRYLRSVLRLRNGAICIVCNGAGQSWRARLNGEGATLDSPANESTTELREPVTLACAVPRGERWEWLLQKATELGAGRIVPLVSAHSVVQADGKRLPRWQAIVREAAEQSERLLLPVVEPPVHFAQFIARPLPGAGFLCSARGERAPLWNLLPAQAPTLLIGPEGGFSPEEEALALKAAYQPVGLGRRILRAETAPLVALSWIAARCDID